MALTLDIINAQEGLSALTDEQKQSIIGLSERDEETSFNRRFGETLGQMDTTIAAESAISRNEGEKTSEYLARALKQLKTAADEGAGFKTTNDTLTAEIADLKAKIAAGQGNEQLKADLDKMQKELAAAKKVNGELQEAATKAAAEYKGKLEGYRMESEIGGALGGLKLKAELAEATKQALLTLAKQNVMAAKHVYDETAGAFIFQNADGTPMKDKSLNNLTVADMLRGELEKMGVLDAGRQQGGAGGQGGFGGGGSAAVDLSNARSQVEADEIIERTLMAQGIAKSDANWQEKFSQMRGEHKELYAKLPLR